MAIRPILIRHLDTNGDGTGTKNANGDYSGAADRFYIQPPANTVYVIARLINSIYDTTGFRAEEYGNLGAPLPNGVVIQTAVDGVQSIDLCDGLPLLINADWGRFSYDVDVRSWGAGNEMLMARWTFSRSGTMIELDGDNNESLDVVLNDSFTGLLAHYFVAQGYGYQKT